jgi:glutathione peroxidase
MTGHMRIAFLFPVLLLTLAGCSSNDDDPQGANAAGASGSGATGGSGGNATGGTAGTGGSGGPAAEAGPDAEPEPACNPPADPGSFYALEAQSLDRFDPVSMCEFRDKVVLIVNIAAKCGYTPQLGGLAALQSQYLDQGLVVLGFYTNQFANQAGSEEERLVCEENYGVNFEVFDLINVNPPDEHPVFTWFKNQDGYAGDVQWNFEKFLVSRDGRLLGRWSSTVLPSSSDLTGAIEAALTDG